MGTFAGIGTEREKGRPGNGESRRDVTGQRARNHRCTAFTEVREAYSELF